MTRLETAPHKAEKTTKIPRWVLGLGPLVLIAALIALFSLLNAPGLTGLGDDRPPEEAVVVESIELTPGQITLTVRNEGADPVTIAQVVVSDYYAGFTQSENQMAHLESNTVTVSYPWVEGDPYDISLITSAGGRVDATIDAAVLSPDKGASFFGLMALLGIYVGVIPIGLGLLWMPFVRRSSKAWIRALLAFTVGLLAYLTIDATLEGIELVRDNASYGGPLVVLLGAVTAYLVLEGIEGWAHQRTTTHPATQPANMANPAQLSPQMLSLLIAVGIGLHNLGEGLAIGSAYAVGSLALGASLVIGFAIHNTTEGLAIVTPLASQRPPLTRLATLGLIAGAPAILGALIGATVYQPTLAAFLLGIGAGALGQVAIKLLPMLQDHTGRTLTALTTGGIITGLAFMFTTGLLVIT
ncbi:ZIP family metal transporter [Arthrobacter sp. H14]|uniref:ZIP family metal transporter n=1 Tax=Arthrobacter sp. H14 TaxID=1312959 RepID=UPI0004BB0403|nr:metal transporter [Arthrobacter sp. H14]